MIYLAVWLNAKGDKIKQIDFGIIPLAVILGTVGGLIAIQTDVSAAVTDICARHAALLYGWRITAADRGASLCFNRIGRDHGGHPETRGVPTDSRISGLGFRDINTIGSEQIAKSFTAFMDGGWFGVGLGKGVAKLVLLPVPHTDSIFAVVGEELGFVGASCSGDLVWLAAVARACA